MYRFLCLLVLFLGFQGLPEAQAQVRNPITGETDLDRSRMGQAAFYRYAESGDAVVDVNVWGTVRFPGHYELLQGATLKDAISLAGGPSDNTFDPTRFDRETSVQLVRNTSQGQETILDAEIKDVANLSSIPLQAGDIIFIRTVDKQKFNWRNFGIPLAGLTLTVVNIFITLQRTSGGN